MPSMPRSIRESERVYLGRARIGPSRNRPRSAGPPHAGLGALLKICHSGDMPSDPDIAELAHLIDEARRAVVFTGAGISTEFGHSRFPQPRRHLDQNGADRFSDFIASEEARRETWRRRFAMEETFREAGPNRGHRAVAELVRRGKAAAVITQNIDGLHQASGIPEDRVIELHGNTTYAHCLDCAQRYEIAGGAPRL